MPWKVLEFYSYLPLWTLSYLQVKVWCLPEEERLSESIATLNHAATLPGQEKRIESVAWSPVASGILAASVSKCVKVFDVDSGEEKIGKDSLRNKYSVFMS